MAPVIAKIVSMQPNFTVGENEIAQYIIHHPDAVIASTISDVVKETGTSEASLNRFCKKLGYKGFNRLKVALAQESAYTQMTQATPSAGVNRIAALCQDYQRVLLNTTAMLDETTIRSAAKVLRTAGLVYVFGLPDTSPVALEFANKLTLVGIPNKAVSDISNIQMECSHLRKSDFVVFILSTVFERDILPVLQLMHEREAKSLIITSYDAPQLESLVDMKLITSDIITTQNAMSISNNLIFLYVVDVLYASLLDSDKALREKKMNSDAMRKMQRNLNDYDF